MHKFKSVTQTIYILRQFDIFAEFRKNVFQLSHQQEKLKSADLFSFIC